MCMVILKKFNCVGLFHQPSKGSNNLSMLMIIQKQEYAYANDAEGQKVGFMIG